MHDTFTDIILQSAQAKKILKTEMIQELWSGYGKIIRYHLEGGNRLSVVAKHVRLVKKQKHPRGWNNQLSHKRKLRSYQVETAWYKKYSTECHAGCPVPECLALETRGDEVLIVLEDLIEAGFPKRKERLSWNDIEVCISWLASFHATFMGRRPDHLWKTGTYWHLKTRPDELKALNDPKLKKAAPSIDQKLANSSFQTIVHGDAKLANFCFSRDSRRVAAVDFQYTGGGCGMKDLAYFIGSCLDEGDCETKESRILDFYFAALRNSLSLSNSEVDGSAVEADWRPLYPVAWTDFYRFLKGWSPGHWKINSYSERLARDVLNTLT